MAIRRVVPNIVTSRHDLCRDFYVDFLGLTVGMDMGWIATYVSPDNPVVQVSLVRSDNPPVLDRSFSLSIEVDNVDRLHEDAIRLGISVVYPLTNEPWGARRFHVTDPNGVVVNLMCHLPPSSLTTSASAPQ